MLSWVKDAPQYEQNVSREIIHFVDKYITCKNDQSDEMRELVNLQTYRHARTCKKGGHKICSFSFPLPPVPGSMILEPLKEIHFKEDELKEMKNHCDQIKNFLDDMKYGQDIAFETFLEKLKLVEDLYLKAIRYSLKRPTLFLRRPSFENRINNYNPNIFKLGELIWVYNLFLVPMPVLFTYSLT